MTSDTHIVHGGVLGGRYLLTRGIAGGGMGDVWAATDQVLGREVAVKLLRREYAEDPTFLERFRAEARHAAGLSHPGVAAVYDYGGEEDGAPFLVLEFVPGEPLSVIIARDGPLRAERTLDLVAQAAFALDAAHLEGVIHRDVKPGNLIVTPEDVLKITDFGISRAANSVPLTRTGAIMGTAHYISPEQASGRPVAASSDIYSLGIVAYQCLSGRLPFDGDTPVNVALAQVREPPPALPPEIPAPVRDLVMRMLAKDPAHRPATAGDAGREAVALVDAGRGDAGRPQPPHRPQPLAAPYEHVAGPGRVGADTDPGFQLPPMRRRTRWLPMTVSVLAVALLVLSLVRACAGSRPGQSTGDAAPARPAAGASPSTQPPSAAQGVVARETVRTVTVGPAGGVPRTAAPPRGNPIMPRTHPPRPRHQRRHRRGDE